MISEHNFTVTKNGTSYNMHDNGIWVNFFRISSPNAQYDKVKVKSSSRTHVTNSSEGERKIDVQLLLEADTKEEYENLINWVYELLFSEGEMILSRDNHPGENIYAIMEGDYSPDDITSSDGEINIELTMVDPYIYGPEMKVSFVNGRADVYNKGVTTAYPVYEIEVLEDTTHLDILAADNYFSLGEREVIGQPIYQEYELVYSSALNDTSGWTTPSTIEDGYVAGSINATTNGFVPASYGTTITPKDFQGPALRRSVTPLQDLQIDLDVDLLNEAAQTGMVELHCKDADGNVVMKIGVEDVLASAVQVQGKFQVGKEGSRAVDYTRIPAVKTAWNNYRGIIRLIRKDDVIRPYFAIYDEKGNHDVISSTYGWRDSESLYQAPIVEVVLAMRIFPDTTPATMRASNLKIYKINKQPEGVPIILKQGDKVVIDTYRSLILVNNEEATHLKDFFSSFFQIKKGDNVLLLEPATKLTGFVRYKERSR